MDRLFTAASCAEGNWEEQVPAIRVRRPSSERVAGRGQIRRHVAANMATCVARYVEDNRTGGAGDLEGDRTLLSLSLNLYNLYLYLYLIYTYDVIIKDVRFLWLVRPTFFEPIYPSIKLYITLHATDKKKNS
jgi:hypothetical protein